jgi:hypothetical protein
MVVEVREETRAQDVMSQEKIKQYKFAMCDWELETM